MDESPSEPPTEWSNSGQCPTIAWANNVAVAPPYWGRIDYDFGFRAHADGARTLDPTIGRSNAPQLKRARLAATREAVPSAAFLFRRGNTPNRDHYHNVVFSYSANALHVSYLLGPRYLACVPLVNAQARSALRVTPMVSAEASEPTRRSTSALRWFVPTPVAMLLDSALSSDAKVLAGILLHYDGPRGCIPKVESLTRDMNTSKHTVFRLLEELERYGFLRRSRRGRRNAYNLFPVYEKPVRPDDILATGELSIENNARLKPPPRKTLRKPRADPTPPIDIEPQSPACIRPIDSARSLADKTVATPITGVNHSPAPAAEQVAPVRPNHAIQGSAKIAPVRPVATLTSIEQVSPVRCQRVASVRPLTAQTSHPCDLEEKKNHTSIKNQQQQYPAAALEKTDEVISAIADALSSQGISSDDATAWAPELVDLSVADVTDAAKLLVGKPAYRRDEIRTPAKYLRTLCKTVVAVDRRLREHEALKRGGTATPGSEAMDIFAMLREEDRKQVVERARAFAQPDAALWPMAVAIALHGLNLYRHPEAG